MGKMFNHLKYAALGIAALMGLAATASAQILTVDEDRVEREAAAYQDFNRQTEELRQNILQMRQFTARSGGAEQQMAELEQRKSIIGNDNYEQEIQNLKHQYVQAEQALGQLEYEFEHLRQQALLQVERARQPVIRSLLADSQAQVIIPKRLTLGSVEGIDVTSEFIEKLDAKLPSVKLNKSQAVLMPAVTPEGQ